MQTRITQLFLIGFLSIIFVGCSATTSSNPEPRDDLEGMYNGQEVVFSDELKQHLASSSGEPSSSASDIENEVKAAVVASSVGEGSSCDIKFKDGTVLTYLTQNNFVRMKGLFSGEDTNNVDSDVQYIRNNEGIYIWKGDKGSYVAFSDQESYPEYYEMAVSIIPDLTDPEMIQELSTIGTTVDCSFATIDPAEFVPDEITYVTLQETASKIEKARQTSKELDRLVEEKNKELGL